MFIEEPPYQGQRQMPFGFAKIVLLACESFDDENTAIFQPAFGRV
jgi:hypothetical protein